MQFTFGNFASAAILALTVATSASAAALPVELDARGGTAAQSCTAKQYIDFASNCQNGQARYNVAVAVPFNNGSGCNDIKNALDHASRAANTGEFDSIGIQDYTCNSDSLGNTLLAFDFCTGEGPSINNALASMYPMVNGFNCPSE